VLVENSGHIVGKEELYKQVWHDAFVEETNLTKNISILRKILSEGDGERSFIETVPKRGYRFVVPVRKSGSEYSENGSKSSASPDQKIAKSTATPPQRSVARRAARSMSAPLQSASIPLWAYPRRSSSRTMVSPLAVKRKCPGSIIPA